MNNYYTMYKTFYLKAVACYISFSNLPDNLSTKLTNVIAQILCTIVSTYMTHSFADQNVAKQNIVSYQMWKWGMRLPTHRSLMVIGPANWSNLHIQFCLIMYNMFDSHQAFGQEQYRKTLRVRSDEQWSWWWNKVYTIPLYCHIIVLVFSL